MNKFNLTKILQFPLLIIVMGLNKLVKKLNKIMDNHNNGFSICAKCSALSRYYSKTCEKCGEKFD